MTQPTESNRRSGSSRPPRLRVGYVAGVTLTKWRRVWGERYPRNTLEVVEVTPADQRRVLVERDLDACFARLPIGRDGLHVIPLYDEVPVVLARKDHPVSAFASVTRAELAEETVVDADHPDAVALVAGGAGILLVPLSVARTYSRRDLVHRPVSDAPTTTVGLVWPVDDPAELIEDFIGVVRGRTVNSSRSRPSGSAAPAPGPLRTPPANSAPTTSRAESAQPVRGGP